MSIANCQNYGIRGLSVTGFTLTHSGLGGTLGTTTSGHESAIAFGTANPGGANGLIGTGLMDNVDVSGAVEHQVEFYSQSSSANLTISTCNIHDNNATTGGSGIQLEMAGTANTTLAINNSNFTNNRTRAVQFTTLQSSVANVTMNGNTLQRSSQGMDGILLQNAGDADLTTTISNNLISGLGGSAIFVGQVANNANAASDLRATISGNTVITPATATNHAILALLSSAPGQVSQARLLIDLNTVYQNSTAGNIHGILVDVRDSGSSPNFHATVTSNKVEVNDQVAGSAGIAVQSRQAATGHADIRYNGVDFDNGTPAGAFGLRVLQADTAALEVERGALAMGSAIAATLTGNNSTSTNEVFGTVTVSDNNVVLLPGALLMFAPEADRPTMKVAALPEQNAPAAAAAETTVAPTVPGEVEIPVQEALNQALLDVQVKAALSRWEAAGLSDSQMALLKGLRFELTDLPGMHLGHASGSTIKISTRAAGQGWFVDATPGDDAEFSREVSGTRQTVRAGDTAAADRVDLLTAIMHEMGHVLGLADRYDLKDRDSVMFGYLARGERRLPAHGEAASVAPFQDENERFLSALITLGTLPPAKSLTVVYDVTIDTTAATSISSQAMVGGSNFANVLTNDPDTVTANDATVTLVEQLPTVSNIAVSVNEGAIFTFTATQFDAGFSDVNALPAQDTLQAIQITSLPANGTLTKNVTNDAVAVNDLIARADIANLKFTPGAGYFGPTNFGWKASDGQAYSAANALVNITVNEVNSEPTLNAISNPAAILEGAPQQTVNLSGISAGAGEDQTLTVTAVSNNTALIPHPTVTYTSPDATGQLRYTPLANAFGTATVTVTVQDNGGTLNGGDDTLTRTFTVTVTNVNDAPTLSAIMNPSPILPTAGQQTVNLAGISEGPNESAQTLNITALSSNPGVIPHPAVNYVEGNSTGTLTYTPTGAIGSATITVSVQDNGGTLNGGVDLTTRTFTVAVTNFVAVSTVNPGDDTATESGDTGVFTFTRGVTNGALVASFQLDPGSTASAADHVLTGAGIAYNSAAGTGTVTFPDGVASVTATLTAAAEAVQFAEANETVTLNVVNQPGTYIAGTPASATVTIAQNGFIVINTNDAGEGSLRQAVLNANALSGADTITFAGSVFEDASADTITLTSSEIAITSEVVIQGLGAKMLTLSGNQGRRIFYVNVSAPVRINDLSLTNGFTLQMGGALYNDGADLTLTNCRVASSVAITGGGGLASASGRLTLVSTTVSGNTASASSGSGGAGIQIGSSALALLNSTVTGNSVNFGSPNAGGIWISSASPMVSIINSTITQNIIYNNGSAAGVYVAAGGVLPLVFNSIIAGNVTNSSTRDEVIGAFDPGSSYNIIGDVGSATGFSSVNGNITGTAASPVSPLLASLADNGGPTATHALTNGSPALNAGGVISERQQVTVTGGAGTFTLTFNGQTTMTLTYNTSAAAMQAALESLSNIGFGKVIVSLASNVYTVSFQGTLAGADQPQLTATPAGGATVNIVTQMNGGTPAYDQRGAGFPRQVGGVQDMGAYEAQQILMVASASQNEANAGGPLMNFTLTRSGPTTDATFVDFNVVASGTNPASAADFVGGVWPSGSVTIPAGVASVPLTIPVLGDNTVEYDETFTVVLSNAFAPYLIGSTSVTGTITNDDTATVSIEKISNGAEITVPIDGLFRVTLSARSSTNTTLAYLVSGTASEEVDYSTLSRSVTIPAGQTTADIVVDVLNDGDANESLETVVVTLSSISSGNPAISLGSPVSATVDIISTPVPLSSPLGDVVTDNGAPGTDGITSIGDFDILRRGAFLAENSEVVFPGSLIVGSGSPPVTMDDSQGIWKGSGGSLNLTARTGTTVPDIAGTVFDYLPIVPAITDAGEVTLLASLRIGVGGVTAENDTGIWSEVGGGGLSLVLREGDVVPGLTGVQVGRLASGAYATATTGPTTGEIAFSVTFKGDSKDTAILRASVSGAAVSVQVVARENSPAPGTALQFGNLAGSYSDPARMDGAGNLVFAALTKPGNLDGIWYQRLGGSLAKVVLAGETAPGTSGATFSKIQRPSMGSNGRIAFRGLLNANGDNNDGLKNDGIWFGEAANPASFTCILRRGDTNATVAGLTVTQKVGNVWGGWLSNGNRGAWKGWVDMDGNGSSAAPADVHGIYANTSGAMELIVKAGDPAPGVSGATFTGFDLPLVGGQEQAAFLGVVTGPGITPANNQGLWREGANGGGLALLLRTGDTIPTTAGSKTIQAIDFSGSGQTDRRWEQPVMDSNGRILMNVLFTDGSSSQLISP